MLAAISQVAQSLINARTARTNTDKTNQANRELAEYSYGKDLEMWEKGNLYNSPSAQMDRLRSAGLNPNLVYGSGSAAGNSAGTLPKYNAPRMDYNYLPPVDIPAMIGAYQDFNLKNAQIDNVEAQSDINENKALWSYLSEAYRVGTAREKEMLATVMRQIQTGDFSPLPKLDPKNRREMGWSGEQFQPSEFQKSQLDYLKTRNRKIDADISNVSQQARLNKKKADLYIGDVLGRLGIGAANALSRYLPGMSKKGMPGASARPTSSSSPAWRQWGARSGGRSKLRYVK